MVTKTVFLVAFAYISALGLFSSIFLVIGQEERSVEDETVLETSGHGRAGENMVETAPFSLKLIGALGSIRALGIFGYMHQPTLT